MPPSRTTALGSSHGSASLEDYRELIHASTARIARFQFEQPISSEGGVAPFLNRVWSTPSACIDANHAFSEALGFKDPSEIIGHDLSFLLPRDSGYEDLFRCWFEHSLQNESFQVSTIAIDGSEEILQCIVYSRPAGSGFDRLWVVLRDVSDHARAVEALARAERHYRTLVERPGLLLVRVTSEGKYLYLSPTAKDLLGLSIDDFNAKPGLIKELVHPEDLGRYDVIGRARRERLSHLVEAEYRLKQADGSYHWYFARQFPRFSPSGVIESFDLIAIDIEEHKRLQRQAEHTHRLDTLGSLAAGIAHDFNNHLTAILGQLTVGLAGLDSSHPSYSAFKAAEKGAWSCTTMSRQLLTFGKRGIHEWKALNLGTLVHEAVQLLKHLLPSTIEITVTVDQALRAVRVDPTQLHQVVMNLAVNARDAMPDGGRLGFQVRNRRFTSSDDPLLPKGLSPGDYVCLSVSDTGSGMSESQLAKIFDPFFTTKGIDKGAGLGLSMVRSIVLAHHGAISASSTPRVGTSFRVLLPAFQGEIEDIREQEVSSIPRGHATVLVADDEEMVRSMLTSALQLQGYTVIQASNGEEAVQLYTKHAAKINLILLDDTMPKLAGRDAALKINALTPNAKIILTSGYGPSVTENLPPGMVLEFLAKPYSLLDLFTLLGRMQGE